MNIDDLDTLFQIYGYEVKERNDTYRVYLLNQGMYHGAEIQILEDIDATTILDRYGKLGYHAKKQYFESLEDAESYLFRGFFNTQTTAYEIERRYREFSINQVKHYGDSSIKYQFIDMPYLMCDNSSSEFKTGTSKIVAEIKDVINRKGAHLVVVEAAAGFGKTCTAYEVYNSFINECDKIKPIFTELSRNRDAKQFKYILWDEIDREKDTTAKQELVVYNIKKGKIPLIIDGFDELLSKDIDQGKTGGLTEFEQVETMLSTIGDLLTDEAKIILTSRKTAIFAGNDFADWVDSYSGKFDVIRFQLGRPDIKEWLSPERYNEIIEKKVPLEGISNPVLLTYLRNVHQNDFDELLSRPETITDKYFEYLLNREKERQNIYMPWTQQMELFVNLAYAFAEFDISGESRRFVKDLIVDKNYKALIDYRETTPTKMTLDELADTLVNHALLDRYENKDYICFVNEFVFGYLLGKSLERRPSLLNSNYMPESLIELAVSSYEYSSKEHKKALWENLCEVKGNMSIYLQITMDSILIKSINGKYENGSLNSMAFKDVKFSTNLCSFKDFSFVDLLFEDCVLDSDSFDNVFFIGCKFDNCRINTNSNHMHTNMHFYGCEDYSNSIISSQPKTNTSVREEKEPTDYELQILAKYFKVDGKTPKMRYISTIRKDFEGDDLDVVFACFDMLKKRNFILTSGNNSYITKLGITYYHKNISYECRK